MSRPEDHLPPDLYYNESESAKYTTSSRIQHIQSSMTHRALSLLHLPPTHPSLVLDLGCGSGLSGSILSSTPPHHIWVGIDISPSMLAIALERQAESQEGETEAEGEQESGSDNSDSPQTDQSDHSRSQTKTTGAAPGDLFLSDIGQGLPFLPGVFDAAISISAIQWLCNADTSAFSSSPDRRLRLFFDGLYASLKRGGRAALQFYPRDAAQRDMITRAAVRAGFGAGVLIDDEGTKNEKIYLVLRVGGGDITGAVEGLDGVDVEDARRKAVGGHGGGGNEKKKGGRKWVLKKKEQMRSKGKVVKPDSKYTGRRRRPKF